MVICIWCAPFVTSRFDVIFVFPNQRFGEVCWHLCIFFYIHSPYFMCHCAEYKILALQIRLSEENKHNATTQQFIIAKISSCALKQGCKTHSLMRQSNLQLQNEARWCLVEDERSSIERQRLGCIWCTLRFEKSDLAKLHRNWECSLKHPGELPIFCYVWNSSKLLVFLFPCWDIIKCLNASMLTTAVFEFVQQFYYAAEIGNVANGVSDCADQP